MLPINGALVGGCSRRYAPQPRRQPHDRPESGIRAPWTGSVRISVSICPFPQSPLRRRNWKRRRPPGFVESRTHPRRLRRGRNESTKWFRVSRSLGYLHRGVFDGYENKSPRTVFTPQRTGLSAVAIHGIRWRAIDRSRRQVAANAAPKRRFEVDPGPDDRQGEGAVPWCGIQNHQVLEILQNPQPVPAGPTSGQHGVGLGGDPSPSPSRPS